MMQKRKNMERKKKKKINKKIMAKMMMKKIKKTRRVLNIFPAGKLFNINFFRVSKANKKNRFKVLN